MNPLVSTVRLYSYAGGRALFRLLLELAFVAYTIYYMVVEIKKLRKLGFRTYIHSFWSVIEVMGIVTSIVACAFYGAKFIAVKLTMNKFHDDKGIGSLMLSYSTYIVGTGLVSWILTISCSICLIPANITAKYFQLSGY